MTAFGIIASELGSGVEHYVGEDDALWDWLVGNDFELTGSGYRVQAPVGYVFHQGNLFAEEDYSGGKKFETVTVIFPENDKANMMLVSLRAVSSEEFQALKIDEDRTMEIEIY